jgi:hypothetical protein
VVNATAGDIVDVGTGLGEIRGRFTVVVHGDNAVDAPELVALRGTFTGTIDFSPALLHGQPFGTVAGHFTIRGRTLPFAGTFRLPFLLFVNPESGVPCDPATTSPCVQATPGPVYVDLENPGELVTVRDDEYSLGFPAVRFDIRF